MSDQSSMREEGSCSSPSMSSRRHRPTSQSAEAWSFPASRPSVPALQTPPRNTSLGLEADYERATTILRHQGTNEYHRRIANARELNSEQARVEDSAASVARARIGFGTPPPTMKSFIPHRPRSSTMNGEHTAYTASPRPNGGSAFVSGSTSDPFGYPVSPPPKTDPGQGQASQLSSQSSRPTLPAMGVLQQQAAAGQAQKHEG